jgi:hypothetical protein
MRGESPIEWTEVPIYVQVKGMRTQAATMQPHRRVTSGDMLSLSFSMAPLIPFTELALHLVHI